MYRGVPWLLAFPGCSEFTSWSREKLWSVGERKKKEGCPWQLSLAWLFQDLQHPLPNNSFLSGIARISAFSPKRNRKHTTTALDNSSIRQ
jgi:hypothetical protein